MPPPRRHASHAEPLWYVGMAAWLILTAAAVNSLVTSGRPVPVVVVAVAAAAVHSVLFAWIARNWEPGTQPGRRPPPVAAISVLALVGLGLGVLSSRALIFFFVAAAVGGLYLPRRLAVAWIGAATTIVVPLNLRESSWVSAIGDAVQFAAIGFFCYGWARLEEMNAALAAAREEVGRLAVADERVRFSRELHDLLGHTLSVIRIKSELASRLARDDPDRAAEEMAEVERVSRAALGEVRQAVSGYRADLAAELQNAQRALAGAGIDATVTGDAAAIATEPAETFAWVLREAVTNVLRHANAHTCEIRLSTAGGLTTLVVNDDGTGLVRSNGSGTGLRSIRERITEAGGQLEVTGEEGRGTRLTATFPVVSR